MSPRSTDVAEAEVHARETPAGLPPMTATKRSARLGVRTSPSASSCARGTPSKSRMPRPNSCRSWMGPSARAASTSPGRTMTSR